MKPFEIAKNIYWVGAVDWNIRDFHGYSTYQGSTYNAFLVVDEQTVLIDTVKKEFADEFITNISSVIDPKRIDMVISNHTEMDHSGSLPRVMHRIGEDKPLYCSQMGYKNLSRHFPQKWNYRKVEDGEEMSLGKRSIKFFETRMLHWPDSMFSYVPEDGILFSSDAFGQHYAGPERFDDEIGDAIMPHAKKYFANILMPFSPLILKLLNRLTEAGIELNMICPDHGIMWRENPGKIIDAYVGWSTQAPARKAVVVYDTMWHSTEIMANAIVDALCREGVYARPMHLRSFHRSDVITEVLDAGAVIVGSPTLNNGIFPTVSDFMTYMKGLKPKNKVAAAFGSYGWSGESVKLITEWLESMKFQLMEPGVKVQYVPDESGLDACLDLAARVAAALPPAE
jgi:flavorubredoxin